MYADASLLPWLEAIVGDDGRPAIFDAHTHVGHSDPDGIHCSTDELVAGLEVAGSRAVVFPLHEPGGYAAPNDAVLADAAASGGRLVAFCRLDPADDPLAEAARCLDAGARGIKLHPRAERFDLAHPGVDAVFGLAEHREVPILVHAGRGIPALGRHALELLERHPGATLILAHAGLCDLGWLWRELDDHPRLFFDAAWSWAPDLLALFALVPPGRILHASDTPYGAPVHHAVQTLRLAREVGLSGEQLEAVLGGQLERLLAGEPPLDLGPAPGADAVRGDLLLDRVAGWLQAALAGILAGGDGEEPLALARLACEVGDGAPQGSVCRAILLLLDRQQAHLDRVRAQGATIAFPDLHLLSFAAVVARTPAAPVPHEPGEPPAGERLRDRR